MANIKVSELPSTTTANDEDYLMLIQSNANKKITKENFDEYKNCKKVTLNNEWLVAHKVYGGNIMVEIPILNPNKSNPTINITSAEIYTENGWQSVTLYGVGYQTVTTTHIYLRFNEPNIVINYGSSFIIRLIGTIEV